MGEPVRALALRYPTQGHWTEEDYFALEERWPRVELAGGRLEVLSTPNEKHQQIQWTLIGFLRDSMRAHGGIASSAGQRLRLAGGTIREPDLTYLASPRSPHRGTKFWTGADLVVEIVSESSEDRVRDLVAKRREYASAGIGEYWIVDPEDESVTVLALDGDHYREHGVFTRGTVARSCAFPELTADVGAVFDVP